MGRLTVEIIPCDMGPDTVLLVCPDCLWQSGEGGLLSDDRGRIVTPRHVIRRGDDCPMCAGALECAEFEPEPPGPFTSFVEEVERRSPPPPPPGAPARPRRA